jgi:hypothetical protein
MALAASAALAGCHETPQGAGGGDMAGPTSNVNALACAHPIQGSKYGLCGHLATASIALSPTGRSVIGSVDSEPGNAHGANHQVIGGTFHATH